MASILEIVKSYHKASYECLKIALELDESQDIEKRLESRAWYKNGIKELEAGISVDTSGVTPKDKEKITQLQMRMKKLVQDSKERINAIDSGSNASTSQVKTEPKPQHNSVTSIHKKNIPKNGRKLRPDTSKRRPWNPSTVPNISRPQMPTEKNKSSNLHKELLKAVPKELLSRILDTIVEPSANTVSFKDITGQDTAKKALQEIVILPALRPDVFSGLREPAKGLLLFGPPGNGKTLLAKAVANEANARFFNISAATLTSKWVGEGEKLVKSLFAAARHLQPSIIFIDEIDSLLRARKEGENDSTRRLLNEFLLQFDGVSTKQSDDDRLLVMGATNRPQELDIASIRRFPKRIYIRLPDAEARSDLLTHLLSKHDFAINSSQISGLAKKCVNYSFSDLTNLAKDAAYGPIRELSGDQLKTIDKNKIRKINLEDFLKSLKRVRSSIPRDSLQEYEDWNLKYGDTSDT